MQPDGTIIAGPALTTIVINWFLFGVLSLQVYSYMQAFPKDKSTLKAMVGVVYALELTQTFMMTQTVWPPFVSNYGNAAALDDIGTLWLSVWIIGGLVGLLVQSFYAYRIGVFLGNGYIPGFIILISITAFGAALGVSVYAQQAKTFSKLFEFAETQKFPIVGLWGASCALCDGVIAGCMFYFLRRRTSREGLSKTRALVNRIIRMTIETGLLTASVSILTLLLYYSPKFKKLIYFVVPMCEHAKFYSNTMMAVLNSRAMLNSNSRSTNRETELVFADLEVNAMELKVVHSQ